ncbi:MAG: hydantoinase/oxoprolinase family protein [Deltaproteobacteria bacterium]|nr:hydantoinase/oxoprolinase family protein [Deltaproteobacteria bacterium]
MILGLDVGGTQTDAVLLDDQGVLAETKTPTGEDLLETLRTAVEKVTGAIDPGKIKRMVFSTTMATNAIVQDQLEPAGMIVSAGPGMNPEWFSVGPSFHVVGGCLDHQGFEAMPVDREAVEEAAKAILEKGISVAGIAGKFSVRNPAHELQIAGLLKERFSAISLGHKVSGSLNFPRRIATTYLNAALHRVHEAFMSALMRILNEQSLKAPRYLLKPDGGTIDLASTLHSPAATAQSGPAASVMGALALDGCPGTALVLDVGGTTTDMSVVLAGIPLLEPRGIRIGPYQTLVRSLLTHSIGIGGDSEVTMAKDGSLHVGPRRQGPPMAFGGTVPTPTDAMVALGLLEAGDREAANIAMKKMGDSMGFSPKVMAQRILETMARSIADSAEAFLARINSRPVYTIHEVLQEEKIVPDSLVVIGGPAPQVGPFLGEALGLPHRVPKHFGVANAIGAAVARVTAEITVQADTERGSLVIPEAGIDQKIPYRYQSRDAMSFANEVLRDQAVKIGADPDSLEISVIEEQVFNMIRGYARTGQNIRIKLCITPGIIREWKKEQGS